MVSILRPCFFTSDSLHTCIVIKHKRFEVLHVWDARTVTNSHLAGDRKWHIFVKCIWLKPWGPEHENIGKPFYFNLQSDIGFTLFTPIKGRIDSLTVYIYKAETCEV